MTGRTAHSVPHPSVEICRLREAHFSHQQSVHPVLHARLPQRDSGFTLLSQRPPWNESSRLRSHHACPMQKFARQGMIYRRETKLLHKISRHALASGSSTGKSFSACRPKAASCGLPHSESDAYYGKSSIIGTFHINNYRSAIESNPCRTGNGTQRVSTHEDLVHLRYALRT